MEVAFLVLEVQNMLRISPMSSLRLSHRPCGLLIAMCCLSLAGCESVKILGDGDSGTSENGGGSAGLVNVSFLLSMTWDEAKKINTQHLEIPPFYKVAADEIQVLKADKAGNPIRVRAKGHVFMQVDFNEELTSLGQEAYVESGGELIMRGKPLLRRGKRNR